MPPWALRQPRRRFLIARYTGLNLRREAGLQIGKEKWRGSAARLVGTSAGPPAAEFGGLIVNDIIGGREGPTRAERRQGGAVDSICTVGCPKRGEGTAEIR